MFEIEIRRIISELCAEIQRDFFDIPFIAESIREDLGIEDDDEIRHYSMDVIAHLMENGIYPGDFDFVNTISFWPGQPSVLLDRIDKNWKAIGKTPNSAEPICWFGKLNHGNETPQKVKSALEQVGVPISGAPVTAKPDRSQ